MYILTSLNYVLLLFIFLISLVHHHHPALLHHQALILDHLLIFLTAFSTLLLKLSFSQSLSLHRPLSNAQVRLMEFDHSVFDSHLRTVAFVSVAD